MNKKTGLCIALWLAALICCLLLADQAMRRDDGERKYGAFFEEQNDFDVLFMGSSRVLDSVQPMEIWRDYGFATYNLGNSSECVAMSEWILRLSLEHNKPRMVVLDVGYVDRNIDDAWAFSYRHMFFDELPLSKRKVEAVRATLPQSEWLEFLMPFSLYHGRWEELLSGQVERIVDCEPYMMGAEFRLNRYPTAIERTQEMSAEPLRGHDALRRIAALCKEQGIELVLVAIPAPLSVQEQMHINGIAPIAGELGLTFINLFDEEGLIDWQTDSYDYLGHLNPDGASKITAYLGRWLSENADLSDKRGQAGYEHWDENLALYEAHRTRVWP